MRITDKGLLDHSLLRIEQNQERLYTTQRMALTGEKVSNSSDDPVAYGQIHAQNEMLTRLTGYGRNINQVHAHLGATEATLQGFVGIFNRLRHLNMIALNDVSRTEAVAIEAQQLYDQALGLANQSWNGEYMFSGYSATPPFIGPRFVGDNQKRAVEVSPLGATVFGVSAQEAFGVLPGQDVFGEIAGLISGIRTGNRPQMEASLAGIDKYMASVTRAESLLGAQQNTLSLAQQANDLYALELNKSISERRDIDPARVYSDLAADRYAMEATFAVIGSASRLSILRYL